MRFVRRLGLRARLLLGAVLPALLMVSLLEAIFLERYRADLEQAFVARGESIARQLGPAVEFALFVGSEAQLIALAEATRQSDPVILAVGVLDRDGSLLAHSGAALARLPQAGIDLQVLREADHTVVLAPVRPAAWPAEGDLPDWGHSAASANAPVGHVLVALSHAGIEARQREMLKLTLAIVLGGLVLAGWLSLSIASKVIARLDAAHAALKREKEAAEALARTDVLTGLANRRAFDEAAQREIRRALRYGTPLALVIADIDYFKSINDRFGHHVGDEVLKDVAATLSASVRGVDLVGRWGGEEFVILMPEAGLEAAREAAERMRLVVAGHPLQCEGARCGITASFGVAALDPERPTLDDLLGRADAALYRAKANGRNRVELG
ncbi:MAG: diguanylate cyclase [Rhodocyclaceae bacterium]|nr:diguanylate cyclase [Rhodocyclaceae bacterium]